MGGDIRRELAALRRCGPAWLPWNRQAALLSELAELRYQGLFGDALGGLGIQSRYFPVKAAANYSLLYLILRVVTELPVRRVLELGCGQTSLLFDDLARSRALEVTTLEQDADWAARIQHRVAHRILQAPLATKRIRGRETRAYAAAPETLGEGFDFLMIDGPQGRRRHSRWGALEYVEAFASEEMVLLFDDAQREGEQDTIREALAMLAARGLEYDVAITRGLKSQCLIATGGMRPACYF